MTSGEGAPPPGARPPGRAARHPCPCCGHVVFDEPPGSYDVCPICLWEDDADQLRWPDLEGGANRVSLRQAQRNVAAFGASEESASAHVRAAHDDETVEPGWRPLTYADPVPVPRRLIGRTPPWPADLATLYWWRPGFTGAS